jgi:UDP-glucose 4-epimerase
MKKILVTGGTGFIGANLTQRLIELNYKVLVVDTLKTIGGIPYINPQSTFLKGNITDKKIYSKIKKWKPEIIFHLAAQSGGESSYDDPKYDYLSNGYGTYLMALLAKEIKVKKFIYSSSVAVYGSCKKKVSENGEINPDSLYGISKYIGEMFIKQILYKEKIQTIIFRISNTFGPGENLFYLKKGMVKIYSSYVWKNKPIIVKGSFSRLRNINYIDDCVNILIMSLNNKKLNKNEIFNLCSDRLIKVKDLIYKILKINNKENYPIIVKKSTKGDSLNFNTSNKYLKNKFNNYKFLTLDVGLNKYFEWINQIPLSASSLKNYHPFITQKY